MSLVTRTLVDGTPVTVQLFDEYVNVQRAVTNVQTSREVWVSGKVKVTVGGKAEGGSVNAGYLVGCQVNFGASAEGDVLFEQFGFTPDRVVAAAHSALQHAGA